jgi:eukaryotic-like serine/threonine-protein kinase
MSEKLPSDSQISHYRIISKLGAGGMGEVYLAQDTKLDRKVALKILPAEAAADQKRMRRFTLEAKAASALNHPNILTIYEIEQIGSTNFIATEFIEGRSLRERMKGTPLALSEILDIAIQVASALSAAHDAGIIHRDIKPDNVMMRHDAIVKVLDFGLAKLSARKTSNAFAVDTEGPTRTKVITDPGIVLGTVNYMSPEQARGINVDARTDIFSLGVLIYEMFAGRLPFEGATGSEILAAIINDKEPPPLARFARDIPREIERIISKALRKNREERYQTIRDLLIDLKDFRRDFDLQAQLERTAAPDPLAGGESAAKQTVDGIDIANTAVVRSSATPTGTSSAEYLVRLFTRHRRTGFAVGAVVLLLVSALAYYFTRSGGTAIDSIAVLPLINANNDPDTEYLADGISESLINSLSQLPGLRVVPRSTVFRFKGQQLDPQELGRQLNVAALFTGRIAQRGDALTIQAELIDVSRDAQMWGAQYNRKLSDAQAVQIEISKEIAARLRLRLTGEDQHQLTKNYTTQSEAYQEYLRGRHTARNHISERHDYEAIAHYNRAVSIDPNFAPAYAGLADTYAALSSRYQAPSEMMPKAKDAVLKALALDPSLAEAHLSLAFIRWWDDWDYRAADQEFKRAIELNPNEPMSYYSYTNFLARMGRFDEAAAMVNRGAELDPDAPDSDFPRRRIYFYSRQYDKLAEVCRKSLDRDQGDTDARMQLGLAYSLLGSHDSAITELRRAAAEDPATLGILGYAYGVAGRRDEALKALAELQAQSARRYVQPYEVARVHVGLGDKERAFEWLEKAYAGRSDFLTRLKHDPTFDSLRDDSRFAELLRRMGLNA